MRRLRHIFIDLKTSSQNIIAAVSSPLPALFFVTDPRIKDPRAVAKTLPRGSAIIYRHFGETRRAAIAADLRVIAFDGDHLFLIGADPQLAISCGADGVHFPQRDISNVVTWRERIPEWFLSAAAHDMDSIIEASAAPLNAVTLSPVFQTDSPGSGTPLGASRFTDLAGLSSHPVIALGGIKAENIDHLSGTGAAAIAGVSLFTD